jgi:uncharacterized protein (DUF169 family)
MNPKPNEYSEASENLSACLDLRQSPVAVCFTESVPDGVAGHVGRAPAGCRFWEDGATAVFATSAADHNLCAIGVYTHNLEPSPAQQTDLVDALRVFADLGYVREQDLPLIPVLKSQPKYVVYAPLDRTPLPPDVVLLFIRANQALILSEAAQQVEHDTPLAMGRPACAVIPQVVNSGRAALSLGCCGARAYLNVLTDDVAVFALPGDKLPAYVERLTALSKANSLLARFHQIRRRDVESGATPTVKDSLAALSAS